jgi:hypothetical protein
MVSSASYPELRRLEYGACCTRSLAVGAAVRATVANAKNNAAAANAYNSGYTAGSVNTAYAMGAIYPTVPTTGCAQPNIGGITYYLCGSTWFQPAYGANGVYYRVVPAPG